jgi:DNA-directed RNA polymerase subunit RPC12/RpoP
MIERQELWCHECQKYVQFDIDVSLNGNHVITCPECGHEHCRVVVNGRVTEVRWDSRNAGSSNMQTYMATGTTASTTSTYATYTDSGTTTSSTVFTYGAWMNLASNS